MISEEALKRAAKAADDALLEQMPSKETCEHTFSPGFEQKMKRLARRTKHPFLYRLPRRAACILLPLLLGASLIVGGVPEVQAAFFAWLKETHETWMSYSASHNSVSSDHQKYCLTWIPEGYEVYDVFEDEFEYSISYANSNDPTDDHLITFDYIYATGATSLFIFSEDDAVHKETEVKGNPADMLIDPSGESGNTIAWEDSDTHTLFSVDAYFSEDVLIKMAESVEVCEP